MQRNILEDINDLILEVEFVANYGELKPAVWQNVVNSFLASLATGVSAYLFGLEAGLGVGTISSLIIGGKSISLYYKLKDYGFGKHINNIARLDDLISKEYKSIGESGFMLPTKIKRAGCIFPRSIFGGDEKVKADFVDCYLGVMKEIIKELKSNTNCNQKNIKEMENIINNFEKSM